jgi:hypothetical protein
MVARIRLDLLRTHKHPIEFASQHYCGANELSRMAKEARTAAVKMNHSLNEAKRTKLWAGLF